MPTRRSLLAALAVASGGCVRPSSEDASTDPPGTPGAATPPHDGDYWYTSPSSTGNRVLQGAGAVHEAEPVTFEPEGQPQWLVAAPAETGSVGSESAGTESGGPGSFWTVASADGRASTWRVRDGAAERVATHDPLPADAPPVVATDGENPPRIVRPPADIAAHTAPVALTGEGNRTVALCYIAANGDFVVSGDERRPVAVDALRDGRLAALGDHRYALYTAPSDRYGHGALGDTTEGTALTLVDARRGTVEWRAALDAPTVFEGLRPLVADLDGDGEPEIVTTVADSADGARIAVFSAAGERVATGPVYGPGWRHQLAVAPFGPDGRPELAVVRKPHVDHTLEYYRLDGGSLDVVATLGGFSTHTYGSRVTDGALAGDLDGDGRVEALVPTTERTALAAVRRSADGARVVWERSLPGPVGSNVTGVALADGGLAVGAASGGTVTVWQG